MKNTKSIHEVLDDFIQYIQSDSEIELYNEAGLQHEMALYLRAEFGDQYKIQLERNINVSCTDVKAFCKKEMDIYLVNRETGKRYCIELKLSLGRAVPKRMYLAFQDVLFLEQLRKQGFEACFFMFTSPERAFWEYTRADQNLRKYFHSNPVQFRALYKADVADFLGKAEDDCLVPITGVYNASWKDLKIQDNKMWRYFLIEV